MFRSLLLTSALTIGLAGSSYAAVTFDWATIGNPGNVADIRYDPAGVGAVGYVYRISKHEVTNGQYLEFLNAVAKDNVVQLYSTSTFYPDAGIVREGVPGEYTYSLSPTALNGTYDFSRKPRAFVNIFMAFRFANWMHNGQPTGPVGPDTTEMGAYDLTQGLLVPERAHNAKFFLPTDDEWYKAAYSTPEGAYFDYPTGSNEAPVVLAPSEDTGNAANLFHDLSSPGPTGSDIYHLTDVGAYSFSASPWGTFDQAGNLAELTETLVPSGTQLPDSVVRGGNWNDEPLVSHASTRSFERFAQGHNQLTFRLAAVVPEPSAFVLAAITLGGMLERIRRNRNLY